MMYAADEVYDTAALEEDEHWHDDPGWDHDCHRCHLLMDAPGEGCDDCAEATAMLWENIMRPY